MLTKYCHICKKKFSVFPSTSFQRFCSLKCMGKYRSLTYVGKHHPMWRRITKNCVICSKQFVCKRAYRTTRKTCSRSCVKIYFRNIFLREKSCRWKGGRKVRKRGYISVLCPSHPYANDGYILEHRIIMEKKLKRILKPTEVVHHINGNKHDNRIENLQLFASNSAHITHHFILKRPAKS